MNNKIEIKSIKLNALIGVYPWEQQIPQPLIIDIALGIPDRIDTDDLAHTHDYDQIISHISHYIAEHPCQLIEALGSRLLDSILLNFNTPWVTLTIQKPFANLAAKSISVTLTRHREAV